MVSFICQSKRDFLISMTKRFTRSLLSIIIAVVFAGILINLITDELKEPIQKYLDTSYKTTLWLALAVLIVALLVIEFITKSSETNQLPESTDAETRGKLIEGLRARYTERLRKRMDDELRFELELNLQYTNEGSSEIHCETYFLDDYTTGPAGNFNDLFETYLTTLKRLLILGEPGSGKTVLLLKFTQRLLGLAGEKPDFPLPVILNLATWRDEGQTFQTWLGQNLVFAAGRYGISKNLAAELAASAHLLLLLDGLDEIPAAHRNSCLHRLESYLRELNHRHAHGHTYPEVIICSRRVEYTQMSANAPVQASISILPLAPDDVRSALYHVAAEEGKGLSASRLLRTLDAHPVLSEVLNTAFFTHLALKLTDYENVNFSNIKNPIQLINQYIYIKSVLGNFIWFCVLSFS